MGYKPDVVQKAKFEYSPLGQVFNKGLEKDEKQVGLLKRLKNIEDKTNNQLKENKDNQLDIKSIGYTVRQELSQEAKNMLEKLNNKEKLINYKKLGFREGNNKDYDFTNFSSLRYLFRAIYYGQILIPTAEREQDEFDDMLEILKNYKPRKNSKYYKLKDDLLINAQNFYDGKEMIIEAFKNKMFPLSDPSNYPFYASEENIPPNICSDSSRSSSPESDDNKFDKELTELDKVLAPGLVKKYFGKDSLREMAEQLKNHRRHKNKRAILGVKILLIKFSLLRLKADIRNMPKNEVKIKGLDLLRDIIEKIIDMSSLKTEEEAAQRQQGQGLKILTPQQMITRLPILLAQLKAGKKSQKLKNEIRQLLYHLYKSKNLSNL